MTFCNYSRIIRETRRIYLQRICYVCFLILVETAMSISKINCRENRASVWMKYQEIDKKINIFQASTTFWANKRLSLHSEILNRTSMLGAIIGDIVRSRWEFNPTNGYNLDLFSTRRLYGWYDSYVSTVVTIDHIYIQFMISTSINNWSISMTEIVS